MTDLETRIGYTFQNRDLLQEALTHTSYAHENGTVHNERLEFLGDAVLQCTMSSALFHAFPKADEGRLSRARALLVNTHTLALIAMELGLDQDLKLGKGEEDTGGRTRQRSLAAVTEAMLGAMQQDGGHQAVFEVVQSWFQSRLQVLVDGQGGDDPFKDPRSRLQEATQAKVRRAPSYSVIAMEGPAHAPHFTVEVRLQEVVIGTGSGTSKREAMKHAAAAALKTWQTQ